MLDLWTFSLLLEDIAPSFTIVEGRIFVVRNNHADRTFEEHLASYKNIDEAQYWINLVPIDDLLAGACGEFSMSDQALDKILDIYRRSWSSIITLELGLTSGFTVQMLRDEEYGDILIQLTQQTAL